MPTIFIAVQCFECSTMQVKQQKKSSNKWTCVVCNQKQSQRKVYAQAFMAKDVRLFVTSFNMSRKFVDEQYETLDSGCEEEQIDEDRVVCDRKRRRTNWNEYLNVDDDDVRGDRIAENGDAGSNNSEPKCVTELPADMFKKPKLRNYSGGSRIDAGKGLLRPVFSKRNSTNKLNSSQDKGQIPCQATMKKTFTCSNHVTQNEQESRLPSSMARVASKWDDYITPDDNDLEPKSDNWDDGELQILFEDEMVDEGIHPDFK